MSCSQTDRNFLSVDSVQQLTNVKRVKAGTVFIIVLVLTLLGQRDAVADRKWFVGVYGGQVTDGSINDIADLKADFMDSRFCALIVGNAFWTYKDYFGLEAEGQIVKHWGLQDHLELNALLAIRWLLFPWDRYVDTSFALGEGISYATKDPEIEKESHSNVSQILNYLMFELSFLIPKQSHWSVFVRLHHRSGVFGLINGVSGASNAVGAGLRYVF
jgi:hypothetical protein